jgi:hypothetical protein
LIAFRLDELASEICTLACEHMSLDLAVAVMLQKRWDVPAGTSKTIQVA